MRSLITLLLALWLAPVLAQVPMTGAGKGTPAAAYVGPGDVTAAVAWWGFRAYSAAKAAATANVADLNAVTGGAAVCTLKLATNGDADLTGVYCTGNTQTVPQACAAASGGSCVVSKLYDQVGSVDMAQATLANMPAFSTTAQNSKPGMTHTSAGKCLTSSATLTQAQPLVVSMVLIPNGKSATQASWWQAGDSTIQAGADRLAANNAFMYAGGAAPTASMTDASAHAVQFLFDSAGSPGINVDNTLTSGALSSATGISAKTIGVGGQQTACTGQLAVGTFLEVGIFSGTWNGTAQTNMCHNQYGYWNTAASC